jgi:hypothetical protein
MNIMNMVTSKIEDGSAGEFSLKIKITKTNLPIFPEDLKCLGMF